MILPAPRADSHATRTLATLFAIAGLLLAVFASSASAELDSGLTGGAGFIQQPLSAPNGAFAGKITAINGHIDAYSGPVALTARRAKTRGYFPIGTANADGRGDFTFSWRPPKPGLYSIRIAPAGVASAASESTRASLAVYRRQKATWYGPGFYGSRTACGIKLTKRTLGVAHRKLPCGTQVEFFLRGKRITVPVIDRGPFANGASWDLTLASMKQLGSKSTEIVGALPIR